MSNLEEREELRNYFQSIPESGDKLPNVKDVPDWTVFFLKVGLVYVEHIMFKGNWHKKIVSSSQIVLEKV